MAKGTLLIDGVPQARVVYELLKSKVVTGLSIGYEVIDSAYDRAGHRLLNEIKLWEVSAVTFPANQQATVTDVKAGGVDTLKALVDANASILLVERMKQAYARSAVVAAITNFMRTGR